MAHQRSIEELEKLLQEAEQRVEREQRRAREAERQREEAERQREEERQRADASEQEAQPTTFDEYMVACHQSVFSKITIETNPKLSSRGSITNPRGKWCPKNLRPWHDFIDRQRRVFGILYDTFPTGSRVFENRVFLTGLGNRVSQRRIADEKALEYFLHNSVEDPVRVVINQLKEVEEVRNAFDIGDGVVFENHPHALSDVAEEVVEREIPSTPRTPDHRRDLNQLRPDQICVTRSNDDNPSTQRALVHISEYKSPCKLTVEHLRVGLRPMDIYTEVVNRKTIPTSIDPDAKFQYLAERLTASAVTQTYHYMIESGLEYSNMTIGVATVFLKIDWHEPDTLYYHLAEPGPEAAAHPSNFHVCTAVGQYLAFTLMALGAPGEQREHGQEERQKAMHGLRTWAEDFETTLRSIPERERPVPSSDSPCYQPTTYREVDRSPYLLRRRRRQTGEEQADKALVVRKGDRQDPSDDESAPRPPDTPTPTGWSTGQGQGSRRSERLARRPRGGVGEQGRQYCTQKCLVGLLDGGILDPKCPNQALHRRSRSPAQARHPVDHVKWLELLRKQLEHSLDDGITPLWQSGSRGALFRVTLLAYGYTFVGKGTVRAFIKDLTHEAAVYSRLKPIQGLHVPAFLGAIDLRSMDKVYYYVHRVYVVHMTFLSWGGCSITDASDVGPDRLRDTAIRSLQAMHGMGVVHKDVRFENMLFNREVDGVMMIDFERALLVEPPTPRLPLTHLAPNKRRWNPELGDDKRPARKPSGRRQAEDIHMAEMVFWGFGTRQAVV